jgi:hypothetical protein
MSPPLLSRIENELSDHSARYRITAITPALSLSRFDATASPGTQANC